MSDVAFEKEAHPPISCSDCKLGHLTLYGPTVGASPEALNQLRREVRIVPPARTILREGDVPRSVLTLYSGWAFQYKQLTDGRRQILSFLIPGDTVVLENFCFMDFPVPFSVKSLTQISVCVFSISEMAALIQSSEVQRVELDAARQRYMAAVHERLLDIGRRSALGRVAQLLLELEGRLRRRNLVHDDQFPFPARQEHLADALGLTTVYVNRTLVALRKRGILEFDRQNMAILNYEELRRMAQEE